jgi:nucleoside-diphosphate-sugar epimerase
VLLFQAKQVHLGGHVGGVDDVQPVRHQTPGSGLRHHLVEQALEALGCPRLPGVAGSGRERYDRAVAVWGSGSPRREFLYVDDLAGACLFLMEHYQESVIMNVGVGRDQAIRELAEMMARVTGFKGRLSFDPSQPDDPPQLLVVSRLTALGWQAQVSLEEGLRRTYRWFRRSSWARER